MKRMLQLSVRVNVVKTRFICDKLFYQIKLNFFLSKRIDSFDHYHHHEFRDVNKNKNDNKKLDEEEEILEN